MDMRELAQKLMDGGSLYVRTALTGAHMGEMAVAETEGEFPDWARGPQPERFPSIASGVFCERISSRRELVICGGGHISKPVCALGHMLGYAVTVIDDRPEFAAQERFPEAERVLCQPFAQALAHLPADASYVIVTRGHKDDAACLARILQVPFAYCGMIGSKTKVASAMQRMRALGYTQQQLDTVHSPIGLKIGAHTPEEIAVSIAAELIEVNSMREVSLLSADIMQQLLYHPGRMVMVTIVRREGSAPRGAGARMLVAEDGNCYGTIGGGSVEHAAQQRARDLFGGVPELQEYELGGGEASHLGMVCGGNVTMLFTPIEAYPTRSCTMGSICPGAAIVRRTQNSPIRKQF
ncbi:XdhC family protein [Butyricicoccus porcorum]|uniref:XdhC family protein n=1 Tax=Butyricicoccus porcorum TaxID=1945634 RepID=UPI003F4AC876